MEIGKISVFRLYSGDYIIGKVAATAGLEVSLEGPREIAMVPSMSGKVGLAFRPVCMFGEKCKKTLPLRYDQIMVEVPENELPKELADGYLSEVSGIAIASPSDVPDLTGESKQGSFSL